MPLLEYRVYIVDDANDRILQRIHLMCDSDEMAEERARQLVDRFPINCGKPRNFWDALSRSSEGRFSWRMPGVRPPKK